MKQLGSLFIAILVFATVSFAQDRRIGTFRFAKSHAGHNATVVFRTKAYNPEEHRLVRPQSRAHVKIDGRDAYGAEGTPTVLITSVRLFFDGKRITVPKRLYSDCFDPNFDSRDLKVKLNRDHRTLVVTMVGSDGGGGYEVTWFFRTNGKHSRRIIEV